ncbi:glycine--tRNA ligase subunit beta [Aurantiacibacter spongiae]|uniref:glycine--tRNA ligase subunit beta n=1 Tax=Aurantiacibacter spongiae TaxID=2488860 RepID=UPI0015F2BE4A|nr:glycine--tRNA ligase subunit beta [Aurantiacibacter spongiae]
MSDFLLELRSEEIPARMQPGARAELEKLFRREMDAAGIAPGEITVWSTPRRLVLIVRDLPGSTEAVSEELKGPPVGAPDQAVDGFARKAGLAREELEVREVKGRETYFAVTRTPGRATAAVLAEAVPAIIRDFAWPKSMRWGAASISTESLRWVRPLSGIVALLGEDLVECEVHGVTSGWVTLGHRFHHSGDITIGSAEDYAEKLRACQVIVDHEERADLVRAGARQVAREAGLALVEDEGLVAENAGLTEWPVPLLGRFDADYLDVPPEVIQLTARVNQKYFVCEQDGTLANAFVCTANIEAEDGGAAIVDGNRKVLAARLSDARFFWEQDRKVPLSEHAGKLERITFHEKLGTVADKVERVARLARWLVEEGIVTDASLPKGEGPGVGGTTSQTPNTHPQPLPSREGASLADLAEQAARLAKADLVTEMVGEFPELQGLMGGYYARAEGLPDEVADAIRDHYKPVGQDDEVPTAPVTVAVSLADKLDTLAGFFFIEDKPTGSKDPFALRRAVIGINSLIKDNSLRVSFSALAREAVKPFLWLKWITFVEPKFSGNQTPQATLRWLLKQRRLVEFEFTDTKNFRLTIGGEIVALSHGRQETARIIKPTSANVEGELLNFAVDRLKVQQREAGVRHDLVDAVFALGGEDDLVRLLARVKALQTYIETAEGADLLAAYKRAANILKKEDWQGLEAEIAETGEEDPLALVDDPDLKAVIDAKMAERNARTGLSYTPEPAEKALIDALDTAEPKAEAAIEAEDFEGAMAALASLRGPIDDFFEEVTVNAQDKDKRRARLALLARFRDAVHRVADFGRIEG